MSEPTELLASHTRYPAGGRWLVEAVLAPKAQGASVARLEQIGRFERCLLPRPDDPGGRDRLMHPRLAE